MAKEFNIRIYLEGSALYSITAETEQEAKDKAMDGFMEELGDLDEYMGVVRAELEED